MVEVGLGKLDERGIGRDSLFSKMGGDGNGLITPSDLKSVLDTWLIFLSNSQYRELIEVLDVNEDGLLDKNDVHHALEMA